MNIELLELGDNSIYLLNTIKKIRAFYHEEIYKLPEDEKGSPEIVISEKEIKKRTKLKQVFDEVLKTVLLENEILTEKKKGFIINISLINEYFEKVDTKKIEQEFLLKEQGLSTENARKILESQDMTFNDKVQKIYSNVEKLTDDKAMIKQIIEEKLEEDDEYVELVNQIEELKTQINNKKLEVISVEIEEREKQLKEELSDEKDTLNEFLEFSAEKGELNAIEVKNKDGKSMKPVMKFSMKPVKNKGKKDKTENAE